LTPFIKKFRRFDIDNDGIISYDDCYKLLEGFKMNKINVNSEKVTKLCDPRMSNIVTFSGLCER